MTVPANDGVDSYVGNGVTTAFTYGFKIDDDDDIEVLVDGVTKTKSTDYTVSGVSNSNGGNVTFVVAPADLTIVTLLRKQPIDQGDNYLANDSYHPLQVMRDHDKGTMVDQMLAERIARSLHLPAGETGDMTLPSKAARINKSLAFDSNGLPTAIDTVDASGTTVTASGAVTARSLAARFAEIKNILDFGGVGDDSTDNLTAFNAARDSIPAAGGMIWFPPGTYRTTATLLVNRSNIIIKFAPGVILKPVGSTTFPAIKFFGGTSPGTAINLASNGAFGAITVVLVGGGGAAFAAGDYIQISDVNGSCEVTRIVSISTDTLTLSTPLLDAFSTANTAKVQKLTMLSGVGLHDAVIDGNLNTGADARGVWAYCVRDSNFKNINVTGTTGAGVYVELGHNNLVDAVDLEDCGSAGESDLEIRLQTAFQVDHIRSLRASGFGPQIAFCTGGQVGSIISTLAGGRGIKLQMVQCSQFESLESFRSLATYTGISITVGSKRNQFANLLAVANGAAGVWFDDLSSNNSVVNLTSLNNTTRDLEFNATANDNTIVNLLCSPTAILNSGTRNVILNKIGSANGQGYFVADDSAAPGPIFSLERQTTTPAAADVIGEIHFFGRSSTGVDRRYARISTVISDATNAAERGRMDLVTMEAGVEQFMLQLSTPSDGETGMLVRRNVAGVLTLERVKMGPASGTVAGHKVLMVVN